MEGIHKAIERLYHQGKKGSEIFKLLQGIVSQSGVYKVIKQVKETGSSVPCVRTTTPQPVRTPQLIKSTRQKIQRNCRRSTRQLAKDANISHERCKNCSKMISKKPCIK